MNAWDIVLTIIGSQALFELIKFFVTRKDTKQEKAEGIEDFQTDVEKRLEVLERDGLRTQLLMLILLKPDEQTEILRVAEHYFKDLHGNWYMTSIFNKWLAENGHAEPEWFDKNS